MEYNAVAKAASLPAKTVWANDKITKLEKNNLKKEKKNDQLYIIFVFFGSSCTTIKHYGYLQP